MESHFNFEGHCHAGDSRRESCWWKSSLRCCVLAPVELPISEMFPHTYLLLGGYLRVPLHIVKNILLFDRSHCRPNAAALSVAEHATLTRLPCAVCRSAWQYLLCFREQHLKCSRQRGAWRKYPWTEGQEETGHWSRSWNSPGLWKSMQVRTLGCSPEETDLGLNTRKYSELWDCLAI